MPEWTATTISGKTALAIVLVSLFAAIGFAVKARVSKRAGIIVTFFVTAAESLVYITLGINVHEVPLLNLIFIELPIIGVGLGITLSLILKHHTNS
jgi:hypothetical protein